MTKKKGQLDLGGDQLDLGGVQLDLGGGDLDIGDASIDTGAEEEDEQPEGQTFEQLHEQTLAKVKTGFQQRAEAEAQRMLDATDSEFWFCVCFRTRKQKEAFLAACGWPEVGPNDKYVYGEDIAEHMGIELPEATFVPPDEKPNKDMIALGLIGEEP